MDMETHENILHGREVGKKTGILIGTSNTELNDLVGQQADERVVVEKNLSRLRSIEAGDAVEKGRLSSPVGPNDAVNAVFFDLHIQFIYCDEPAKTLCCFFCLENRHQVLLRTRSRR